MKEKFQKWKKKECLTFKKWGRKNFSLYSTLRKEVKISVLSVAYFLLAPVFSVAMEPDTSAVKMEYDLEEIEVSASRTPALYSEIARVLSVIESQEIEQAPVTSVQDLLEYVASVDIRQRGAEGVQADINTRGGTFDQTLILLNGINITDPQTGHHNLNLPVSLSQIERIEVLEGPAARIYGPNAFSGAINIVTKQPEDKTLSARIDGGSYGYFNGNLAGSFNTGKIDHLFAGNRKRSDGYIENTDFGISNLFYSGQLLSEAGKLSVQTGASEKGFGANSFYSAVYPNQFERTQTIFSSAKWESFSKLHLTPVVYWRRHFDKFLLFRDNPDLYKNHHRTDVWGANLNSWFLWEGGKTAFGAELRTEKILSNVLGEELGEPVGVRGEDAFYTHSKTRRIASVFFEHVYYLNDWIFSAGAMANHISDREPGWNFFPGIDLSYQFSPALKMVASWNTSLRMPTFTDLYYSGPTNIGNPDLKPERSQIWEGGIKWNTPFFKGHLTGFFNQGRNIIDWVKSDGDQELWQSMNHTTINSRGIEINLQYFPNKHLGTQWPNKIQFSYLYNNQSKEQGELISYYVLDNLRYKFVASVNQEILENLTVDLKLTYQDREGNFTLYQNQKPAGETPYKPFFLTDAKVQYQIYPLKIYVSANNLFNRTYFDLGNIAQPGRWMKAGILFDLKFN
ncbi:TonB-dependent receptor plug domain-containing protein [Mariniphaga sediminis]|uniref:TonB-dependent receptor plug domain-containing protein n=1 Tax=Mariniphaga sediminis TaxID=1628158 RepID=UPI0035626BDC